MTEPKDIDLDNPLYYNNRELSWLAFNKRVLEESYDPDNPLLERLKFIAIFSSNLDEFFMVRVAGLKDQVKAGFTRPENKAGLTPKQQLRAIAKENHHLVHRQYEEYNHLMLQLKETAHCSIIAMNQLSKAKLKEFEAYFDEEIFPILTPLAIDAYHPFPMLLNKSINLGIKLEDKEANKKHAIVQVPSLLKRYVPIENKTNQFILLEDLISHFVYKLFEGYKVLSVTEFRITRNADLTIHEEGARDLLKEIEKELKKRKRGAAVRLEVNKHTFDEEMIPYLLYELEIEEEDLYLVGGPLDLTFLFGFYDEVKKVNESLTYKSLLPQRPQDIKVGETIFVAAKKRDLLMHHPFESFEPVVELITDAAKDPEVLAIKQTLYRVSGNSPIIRGLKEAAENGKQVMVLVELKARFDEEQNVQWAKELEKAGCHVVYGMNFLKTHSKITLIVRRHKEQIEHFVHLGTGNYNDKTAKIYTDLSYITSKQSFGQDAVKFFNYLSGFTKKPTFHHLSMAPFDIKKDIIRYIDQEIAFHKQNGNGHIIAKMNSLTDKQIIKKFYEASQAGVKIDLIIRGVCCLRPGIENVSEHIRVRSIVGRYLEHTRIYYFHHNGEERTFLSSADLMTRNMERRVELLFPIYEKSLKDRIKHILEIILKDNCKAREQAKDGTYHYVKPQSNELRVNSQMKLFEMAYIANYEH